LRQAVRVKRGKGGHCVVAEYGKPDPDIPRMADLCRQASIYTILVGGKPVPLGPAPEASMASYDDVMDFPPIEDLDLIDATFVKDGLLATGTNVAARTLADASQALPGPWWVKPLAKAGVGIGGGMALHSVHRDSGIMLGATLLGDAIYKDGLKRYVLGRFLPNVFGSVEVEEERLLTGLTQEEQRLLDEERLLEGVVEEEEITTFGDEVEEDEGMADRVFVDGIEDSDLGAWLH